MRSFLATLLATVLGAGLAPAAHAVQDCELGGERVNPANGSTTAGKSGLMRCTDRASGLLQREQELRNGVFMGVVRFYEKGRLAREHSVNAKGNLEGLAREFAPSGQLLREANHADGRLAGQARSFHPSGQLRRVSFHEQPGGERAVAEFNERGQLTELRCAERPVLAPALDDARLCGHARGAAAEVELFDSRGTLRQRLVLRAGQRVRAESLHDNGQIATRMVQEGERRTEQQFSLEGVKRRELESRITPHGPHGSRGGSVRLREAEFSERGTLLREQRWSPEGEALSDHRYYLNGQPSGQAVYSGSGAARQVEITEFHDSGQRARVARYALSEGGRRLPAGTHQRFNERGVQVAESQFDARGRLTRERAWDEDGRLERDDEVFEDGSRKAHAR